ncbi:MAG: ribosomal protein S18-alanine N-acetyltransferase [Clostridia bacterium]|jgi:ribosomal-protein-alanine N-acetyltransferase|nr:ribosomal protein S18-alanine N-acetyltransferase [Clostridia bacterium]
MFNTKIQKMSESNLDKVMQIENACFTGEVWTKESFKQDIVNAEHRLCFVLIEKTTVIGYAVLDILDEEYDLLKIAIDISKRRQGFATILFNYIKANAKIQGINKISLLVRQSNTEAKNLYIKLGFKEIALRKHAYPDGEHGIFMCTNV